MNLRISFLILTACVLQTCCSSFSDESQANVEDSEFVLPDYEERPGKSMFNLNGMFPNSKSGKGNGNRRCFSSQEEGVCYSRSDCTRYGGTSGESCSEGSGVCCILKSMCMANNTGEYVTVKRNLTHLVEPPNYNPPQQCRFNVPKQKGVCQLKLDFKKFDLAPPDVNGNCNADIMVITGSDNIKTLKMCGEGQKQHLYLHYGSSDVISISLNLLNSNASFSRASYDILVTMIRCDSVEKAPEGCTQYYTQTSDEVRTFNYNKNRVQLNEQMYMVCIRSFTGSSRIKWEKCTSSDSFIVSGTTASGQLSGTDCATDYVEILGSPGGKYCGSEFPLSVTSEAKPLMMWVSFDDVEIPMPNTPFNATVGCYETWTCYLPTGLPAMPATWPCNSVDTQYCRPPDWFNAFTDFGNTGFCLRYTVS